MASQFIRNEKRINRALNRIAAIWRKAYEAKDEAGMLSADVRYCKALHIRERVLGILPRAI